jgi:hypothetical protein
MLNALEIPTLADATSGVRRSTCFVGELRRAQTPPLEALALDAIIIGRNLERILHYSSSFFTVAWSHKCVTCQQTGADEFRISYVI